MNYYEWSQEYENTAREMDSMVMRLKKQRAAKGKSDKKELDDKIAFTAACAMNACVSRRI